MATAADLLLTPATITITPTGPVDRDALFERVCELYPNASKVEMDAEGNIIVTPGSEDSGYRSGEAFRQLANWTRKDGTGRAFDASTNFNLPSGVKRQPDAAWVPRSVLQAEGAANLRTITKARHVPHFLIEVRSPSDDLKPQQAKCEEWIAAGVKEAFLLDPKTKTAYIYRPGSCVEEILDATNVESKVLPGFVLDCLSIWEEL
jgi:Uma2 family endonuclease